MATTPRSYKKNGYTYTESAPGSNKFQNFTAGAKPTVKQVRDDSRGKKAEAVKAFPKGLADRQSTQPVRSKLEKGYSPRDAAGVSKYGEYRASKDVQTKKYPSRPMGMDNAVPPARSVSSEPTFPKGKGTPTASYRGKEQRYRPAPAKKSILGQIIDRVTQPPAPLHPETKKLLDNARKDMDIVTNAFLGGSAGARYKLGKAITDEIKKVKNSLSFWGS